MAETPSPKLIFETNGPDGGRRVISLPEPLPAVGDDFDWNTRDFESFRQFMLEELMARLPSRTRWTPADLEVVIIEILATVLDQLSDMLDRVTAEAYLGTARRPESLAWLLGLIGYEISTGKLKDPQKMEMARRDGPFAIHEQKRMVTVTDYACLLQEHPLVAQAHSWREWKGSWSVINIAVILWDDQFKLDGKTGGISHYLRKEVEKFHFEKGIHDPWPGEPTFRSVLTSYLEARRMVGQEVRLRDFIPVGLEMGITAKVNENYYQSEIKYAIEQALGRGADGFFRSGRLKFGESIYLGDLIQRLMNIEGVAQVQIQPFKKVGCSFPDQSANGLITMKELEVAVCDNDRSHPRRGWYELKLYGGRRG